MKARGVVTGEELYKLPLWKVAGGGTLHPREAVLTDAF